MVHVLEGNVQIYEVAPLTGLTLYLSFVETLTVVLPVITPGVDGVIG